MTSAIRRVLRLAASTPALILYLAVVGFLSWLGSWRIELAIEKLAGRRPELTWSEYGTTLWGPHPVVRQIDQGSACPALWQTQIGDFWATPADGDVLEYLVTEQLLADSYHREPVRVREGDVVLDVGSHLGVFTRMALRRGAGMVVAIEPVLKNIECYKKTFASEMEAGKVKLVEAAAWNERTTLHFEVEEGYHGSARGHVDAGGKVEVPAVTIDDTLDQIGLERLDFIKMDIEGAERFALRGAGRTISNFRPKMAICVYHRSEDRTVVPDVVRAIQPDYAVESTHFIAYFH